MMNGGVVPIVFLNLYLSSILISGVWSHGHGDSEFGYRSLSP